jgi:hypothetical protein
MEQRQCESCSLIIISEYIIMLITSIFHSNHVTNNRHYLTTACFRAGKNVSSMKDSWNTDFLYTCWSSVSHSCYARAEPFAQT